MNALAKAPLRMSVAEFLVWIPGDGRSWQLVDGEPQAMAPASRTHGVLQMTLGSDIHAHLERVGSPCVIQAEPGVIPRLQAGQNVRIPDLAVTCSKDDPAQEAALTDPVLIIEILSPSNESETWASVWAYATIPSVREILVLRSVSIGAELLRRQPDGAWPSEPLRVVDGDLVLDSIGFRTVLSRLYRNTRLRVA